MIIILQLIKPAHTKGAWFGGDFVEHLDKHPNLKKKIQEVPDSNGNAIIMISMNCISVQSFYWSTNYSWISYSR